MYLLLLLLLLLLRLFLCLLLKQLLLLLLLQLLLLLPLLHLLRPCPPERSTFSCRTVSLWLNRPRFRHSQTVLQLNA